MKNVKLSLIITVLAASATILSCKKDDAAPAPLTAVTVSDLEADPATSYDPTTGAPSGYKNKFTFFSFSTGAVVANSDSATTKWDIGFNRTTIIVNAGTSGPGAGGALIQTGTFSDITTAPDSGYKTDDVSTTAAYFASQTPNTNFAIPTGSDAAWYHYDATAHTITPIAGKVLVIKTATGKYAKLEILSFYKGAPATPNAYTDLDSYYTFRYNYQASGSKSLK
ncbi:MAG: HmuY family protein [Cyclobacteriaceae bacterium]